MLNSTLSPAFEQNNVPVVLAANNFYAPYMGVFIRSLLDHASEENNYDIIILEREISKENKRLLKSLASGDTNVSIRFFDPSPIFASVHYVDEEHHWPLEVWYVTVAPHILNNFGRIVTVDVDTLLREDIARLMDEDLDGCCVGGVSTAPNIYVKCLFDKVLFPFAEKIRIRDYQRDMFGVENYEDLEDYKNCVNTGLLIFDCDKYTQELNVEAILNAAEQNIFVAPDQDFLNYFMKGKIKLLNMAWNVFPSLNARMAKIAHIVSEKYNEIYNDSEAYQRAHENPYLVHWAGVPKPWVCPDVPWGSEWWQAALRTPFVGHIIARMINELEKRRQYYIKRYGKADIDVWDPSTKGIDRTKK